MTRTSALAPLALLLACDGKGDDTGAAPTGDLVLDDAHNYTYSGTVDAEVFPVAPNVDVCLDWSAITTDIRGRPVAPADIAEVLLVRMGEPPEDVLASIAANELTQSTVQDYRTFENPYDGWSACLSEFGILGTPFDPVADFSCVEGSSWLVALTSEGEARFDFRTLAFLDPCAGGDGATVVIDDTTASLDFTADLESAPTQTAPAGETGTLDWTGLTTDATGREIDPELLDRVLIGRVDVESVAEVEEVFVRLEEEAAEIYRMDVYGVATADLAEATAADGTPFGGFTMDGVWLVGLECLDCTSPAPVALTVVEVEVVTAGE